MPMGTASDLSGFTLSVSTDGGTTYNQIFGVDKYDRKVTRAVSNRPIYGQQAELETTGRKRGTFSFGGVISLTDPGQVALRTAAAAGTVIKLKALTDGTNGYTQDVKITDEGSSLQAAQDLGDFTYSANPEADPVIVGTGPVIF